MKNITYFDILNIKTLQKLSPIEVSSCYTKMSVGLFTTTTELGRKNWRGGYKKSPVYTEGFYT